ncbi:MAG: SIMPL domain-containing protein, partial [Anaerolineaceae bacterium]
QPQYDFTKQNAQPTIIGFVVTNTVEAKVRKLDTFSKVVDAAVAAGGNDARIQSIRFGIEDNEKLLEQAREAAMKDARKKAEQLAKLGGVSLGQPVTISETQINNLPQPAFAAAGGTKDAAIETPIQPGTGRVVVDISVRWTLK